jgi:hypothetical protein
VVYERWSQCAKNYAWQRSRASPQVQSIDGTPLKNLIMDFTEMPWAWGYKYPLVFTCTFSEWVEAFPMCTEKSPEDSQMSIKGNHPLVWNICVYQVR